MCVCVCFKGVWYLDELDAAFVNCNLIVNCNLNLGDRREGLAGFAKPNPGHPSKFEFEISSG